MQCNGLASAGLDRSSKTLILMENYLWVMHLLATKSAFKSFPGLEQLAAKISMSLLRFTKIVNPERAFYEAGSLCKVCADHKLRVRERFLLTVTK